MGMSVGEPVTCVVCGKVMPAHSGPPRVSTARGIMCLPCHSKISEER